MPFADIRDVIEVFKNSDKLCEVEEEISPEFEISSFLWLASLKTEKIFLFRKVKGYGMPVIANVVFAPEVISLGMGVEEKELTPVFAERVDSAPYITTGLVSARDPDSGVIGRGIHRMEFRDKDKVGMALLNPPLVDIYHKYKEKGEPLPAAVTIGVEPITFLATALKLPAWMDKLAVAGGLRNKGVEVTPGELTGIEIPARAEFLIEGVLDPEDERQDGPFGEISGYYLTIPKTPTFKVQRISHRESSLYHALLPRGREADLMLTFTSEVMFSPRIKELFPFVLNFHFVPYTFGSSLVVKAQRTGREQVRSLILHLLSLGMIKKVVVVDGEVEVEDLREVEWAIVTRCQPDKDFVILEGIKGQPIDPSCPETFQTAKVGIDATGFERVKGWQKISFPQESLSRVKGFSRGQA
jgi:2,5-furandicarboxylate decarboxylase 1